MLHWFYKALAPRGWKDTSLKVMFFTSIIVALNYLFSLAYFGEFPLPHSFVILNGICVGSPFVVLFYMMVRKQSRLQVQLALRSRTDAMTGLPNRRWFMAQTRAAIDEDARGVLVLLDADHFKRVNDTYGHQVGDECLISIAYRLRRSLRTDDLVGRLGGEEFGVFLRNTTIDQTAAICRPMLQPIPFSGGKGLEHLTVTLSLGAVQVCTGDDLDKMMRLADDALYEAKRKGRARLEIAGDGASQVPEPARLTAISA